ncbi:MAG TPA: type II toxin-antitoxin system VapC family toxin [Caulobacteraceae bacterium]|nr:type II toxin-antitoxin system VapC family toxin [Caulobacteraceae bacterium]
MSIYLDTSVAVSLFVHDPHSARVEAWLSTDPQHVTLSAWTAAEFSSALARRERIGQTTPVDRAAAERSFDLWVATFAQDAPVLAQDFEFVREIIRHDRARLRTPDALHLAIVYRIGAKLATLDTDLAQAAQAIGIATEAL